MKRLVLGNQPSNPSPKIISFAQTTSEKDLSNLIFKMMQNQNVLSSQNYKNHPITYKPCWWLTPVILAIGRVRLGEQRFEDSPGK
jgi:hypothetical protein